jgi:hypothetical protein
MALWRLSQSLDEGNSMSDEAVGMSLEAAIEQIRGDLEKVRLSGEGADIRLPVKSVTVQLQVVAYKEASGKAGFKVPFEHEAGGSAWMSSQRTNTVTIVFGEPVDQGKKPPPVPAAISLTPSQQSKSRTAGPATVEIVAVDENGQPVAGVEVRYDVWSSRGAHRFSLTSPPTEADGRSQLSVAPPSLGDPSIGDGIYACVLQEGETNCTNTSSSPISTDRITYTTAGPTSTASITWYS